MTNKDIYTKEQVFFDYNHPDVQKILVGIPLTDSMDDKSRAITTYYYVRDTWLYFPYRFSLIEKDWKASALVNRKTGHCIDKVIILMALLRAQGIPCRLGLAKVKNHIAVDQIVEKFGNDVLVPHGYIEIFLNNKWVKATPAFNEKLCTMLGVHPLEFDGENDSLFQEFDTTGDKSFMEYLDDYGTFNTVPLPLMFSLLQKYYPPIKKNNVTLGMVLDLSKL